MPAARSTFVVVFETVDVCARFDPLPQGTRLAFSYGDQVPDGDVHYWTTGAHAARLARAGLAPDFAGMPVDWLSTLDPEMLGRTVHTTTLADLPDDVGPVFLKPAGQKITGLPATTWDPSVFAAAAADLGAPGETAVQFSDSILRLDDEHRFVLVDGQATTGSTYMLDGQVYRPGMRSARLPQAHAFAQEVADALRDNCPPACTLDVAWDLDRHRWLVIEANPLWSSGPYGCDPQLFVRGVEHANRVGDGRWRWQPPARQHTLAASKPLVEAVGAEHATGWLYPAVG